MIIKLHGSGYHHLSQLYSVTICLGYLSLGMMFVDSVEIQLTNCVGDGSSWLHSIHSHVVMLLLIQLDMNLISWENILSTLLERV